MNLTTKSITPQFHVVYDDYFTTTYADGNVEPKEWNDLLSWSRDWALEEYSEGPELAEEWLDDQEKASRAMRDSRTVGTMRPGQGTKNTNVVPFRTMEMGAEATRPSPLNLSKEFEASSTEGASPVVTQIENSPKQVDPPVLSPPKPSFRTTRSGRISKPPTKLSPGLGKSYDALLSMLPSKFFEPRSSLAKQHAYLESLLVDPMTNMVNGVHPLALSAKMNDPDTLTYHEAMACGDREEFVLAMRKEITELEARKTWNIVPRPANANVLPGTWAFKRKRYPDGRIRKHKARFCVRGDKQLPGIDYFDTYAPVVAWSTIRLMLTMTAVLDLHTKQVDYNNAFAQAPIAEDVYVELPKDFESNNDGDSVLKLNTSLYGMKQSPLVWFEHLKAGLEK